MKYFANPAWVRSPRRHKESEKMNAIARPHYDPALFAPGPARDSRFTVVDQWVDCKNFPEGDPNRDIEFLHRQMNEETNGMENAARNLADFPDAEWEIRMQLARQCSDEARHVLMFQSLFEERGGKTGQYPVMNFQFRIITKIDNLAGRLAVQNRTFEAEGVDAVEPAIEEARKKGDEKLAELFDAQLADEICHVRFANDYISQTSAKDPRSVMRVGRALSYAGEAFSQIMPKESIEGVKYSVNRQGRLEAGFRPEEVEFAASRRPAKRDGV
jgi:uncharacterized ferritin-like protein (DUF455 family)